MKRVALLLLAALAASAPGRAEEAKKGEGVAAVATRAAIARGRAALAALQEPDGRFGRDYPVAVTAMAGLALLATSDDALADPAVQRAAAWLVQQQKDGQWDGKVHVHTHGFATLFLAELYGRALFAREAPKAIARDELRAIVRRAVERLADAQSRSGGWYYEKAPDNDEGSTTVCAVQALRAARNYGIPVEPKVLERGFAYLKAMQNPDGGFRYAGAQGRSMVSGTAAAVATLVLMQKLDEKVLLDGVGFLGKVGGRGMSETSFGQYGTFYGAVAMKVIGDEYGAHVPSAARWTLETEEALLAAQRPDGSWASRDVEQQKPAYGTSLALLALAAPEGRLSILHRRAPRLPE